MTPSPELPADTAARSRRRLALLGIPLAVLLLAAAAGGGALLANRSAAPTPAPEPTQPSAIGGSDVEPSVSPAPATPLPTSQPSPTAASSPTPDPTPEGPTSLPPEELTGFVWPLRNARLSGPFGPRETGFLYIDGERIHDGIDLASWCGDKIRAAHDGVVLYAGRKFDEHIGYSDSLDGFYARIERMGGEKLFPIAIVIDYGNGYRGFYVHLSRADVEAGDVVEAGQIIGLEGATGNATGCHLHYALIRMDGAWQQVAPSLVENPGYPPFVRERVDPLLVLPIPDQYAPRRFQPKPDPSPPPRQQPRIAPF
jgi:murein DD-endopeptidase MepM/ murein hydrolase activator NlpD